VLTEAALTEYLGTFRSTAFRFETRDRYDSEVGRAAFQRYLAGEPDDYRWHEPWVAMLRRDTEQGKRWQRVRIVSVPLSDWTRYAITVARLSVGGGEDIRYLRRATAVDLGLMPLDCWILDESILIRLHFDDDDVFRGAEVVPDAAVLEQHLRWRGLALRHAVPLDAFAASVP
jgi:hypothetical protein